ncbi:MAG: hypothetical protein ACOCP4_01170 [Candidatus Woesearchaeota archaeon]
MFNNTNKELKINTSKGEFVLKANEYFTVDKNDIAILNKRGIQKAELFFGINWEVPEIKQQWNSVSNFNFIVTISGSVGYKQYFGVASANPMSLTDKISKAYGVEIALKRAKANLVLEVVRANTTDEKIPLLYSDYDEFKSENNINKDNKPQQNTQNTTKPTQQQMQQSNKQQTRINTQKTSTTTSSQNTIPVEKSANKTQNEANKKTAEKPQQKTTQSSNDLAKYEIKFNKYPNGITLEELYKTNIQYFKWLVCCDTLRGKMAEYGKKAREYAKQYNIDVENLVS